MMKRSWFPLGVIGLAGLFAAPAASAAGAEEFPLRPLPPGTDAAVVEEISYRRNNPDDRGFNRVVSRVAQPTLTVYRAEKPAHRGAAVVICPGGGYEYVVIDREGHQLARYFQQHGLTAIVLKYRLPQPADGAGVPLPQQDALEAIRFVRVRAAEWGVDPARVGVLGCSAGGHLAGSTAILGAAETGDRPAFVALLYPVVCLDAPYAHAGSRQRLLGADPTPERVQEFSLERRVRAGLPPFFLVHARNDQAVPWQNSGLLADALRGAGVPVELLLVARGGHGFALGRDPESARWKDAFLAWLDALP